MQLYSRILAHNAFFFSSVWWIILKFLLFLSLLCTYTYTYTYLYVYIYISLSNLYLYHLNLCHIYLSIFIYCWKNKFYWWHYSVKCIKVYCDNLKQPWSMFFITNLFFSVRNLFITRNETLSGSETNFLGVTETYSVQGSWNRFEELAAKFVNLNIIYPL